ncbi:hypothetical protein KUV73_05475 [Mameliella alba]|nr:hypothetical protein [Mameliella alba]MBY6168978.1 hypothetical protein [Mameliella alba]MBY6173801.1 hypothetical protein [Mameliella alba]
MTDLLETGARLGAVLAKVQPFGHRDFDRGRGWQADDPKVRALRRALVALARAFGPCLGRAQSVW